MGVHSDERPIPTLALVGTVRRTLKGARKPNISEVANGEKEKNRRTSGMVVVGPRPGWTTKDICRFWEHLRP